MQELQEQIGQQWKKRGKIFWCCFHQTKILTDLGGIEKLSYLSISFLILDFVTSLANCVCINNLFLSFEVGDMGELSVVFEDVNS